MRMVGLVVGKMTDEEAERLAQRYRDLGFNIVLCEGNRYLFKDDPKEVLPAGLLTTNTYENIITNTQRMVAACHKYGLQLYLHQTCTMVSERLLREHPDWAAIDIAAGKPLTNGYGTYERMHKQRRFHECIHG